MCVSRGRGRWCGAEDVPARIETLAGGGHELVEEDELLDTGIDARLEIWADGADTQLDDEAISHGVSAIEISELATRREFLCLSTFVVDVLAGVEDMPPSAQEM